MQFRFPHYAEFVLCCIQILQSHILWRQKKKAFRHQIISSPAYVEVDASTNFNSQAMLFLQLGNFCVLEQLQKRYDPLAKIPTKNANPWGFTQFQGFKEHNKVLYYGLTNKYSSILPPSPFRWRTSFSRSKFEQQNMYITKVIPLNLYSNKVSNGIILITNATCFIGEISDQS